ncbi:hypothetical protein [Pedococcus sp. 2YAF34]|uniref:hypothetical protein n=1 Tax=Pedococcus sp. 2YAF34 TaxID=3233032 RepID=UPI003F98B58E
MPERDQELRPTYLGDDRKPVTPHFGQPAADLAAAIRNRRVVHARCRPCRKSMGYLLVDANHISTLDAVLAHSWWEEPAQPSNACQCDRRDQLPPTTSLRRRIRTAYERYERELAGPEPKLPRAARFASSQELAAHDRAMQAYEARLRQWRVPIDAPNGISAWLARALDEEGHSAALQIIL